MALPGKIATRKVAYEDCVVAKDALEVLAERRHTRQCDRQFHSFG
jgi:hypothetical protein